MTVTVDLPVLYPDSPACTCSTCVKMCQYRPCWPTPAEAQALIDAGYGDRLMPDYWVGDGCDGGDIHLLCPATEDYLETHQVPWDPDPSPCVLLQDSRCTLHDLGLKPYEGRAASCDPKNEIDPHWSAASTWNNPEAQALVERWREQYDV